MPSVEHTSLVGLQCPDLTHVLRLQRTCSVFPARLCLALLQRSVATGAGARTHAARQSGGGVCYLCQSLQKVRRPIHGSLLSRTLSAGGGPGQVSPGQNVASAACSPGESHLHQSGLHAWTQARSFLQHPRYTHSRSPQHHSLRRTTRTRCRVIAVWQSLCLR